MPADPPSAAGPQAALNPKDVKVAILMFDGVQIIDFAAPYEVFEQAGFSVYTVSKEGKQVTATQGLKTLVDHSFASAPAANIVVVPGGHIHDAEKDAATLDWIRKQAGPADHVLSVCTGSFILGKHRLARWQVRDHVSPVVRRHGETVSQSAHRE